MKYIVFVFILAYTWAAPDEHSMFVLRSDGEAISICLEIHHYLPQLEESRAIASLQMHRATIISHIRAYLNTIPRKIRNPSLQEFSNRIHELLNYAYTLAEHKSLTVNTLREHCILLARKLLSLPNKIFQQLKEKADPEAVHKMKDYSIDSVNGALQALKGLRDELREAAGGASTS